eukprot:1605626-Amphidinium_carterae.1
MSRSGATEHAVAMADHFLRLHCCMEAFKGEGRVREYRHGLGPGLRNSRKESTHTVPTLFSETLLPI